VIPTEGYTQADDPARLLEISRLQQQAAALKTEIARREALERRLLDVLERERVARAEAESAVRAKSDFLAVMSHELRTPLNAIGGYVQLVEMGVHGTVTDAQRDALARVQRSQRHLLGLIDQVLNLARIERGQMEYRLEAVPLVPLCTDVCAIVESLLVPKRLTCETALSPDSAGASIVVRADREKLQQIMLNLLSNAIKFTPAGGRITISVTPDAAPPAMVHIRVRDTGVGIPPESLERIFEPFVQVVTPRGIQREGAGLGLAISRDLARGMGGDLTVSSTVGDGAIFTLTLPRV
jgi:signal transduction histidine kinase